MSDKLYKRAGRGGKSKRVRQKGGLRVTNIITEENKRDFVGRVVRVVPLPWMPRSLFDENGMYYVRDTLHNIGPEDLEYPEGEGELWDGSFPKAGTIIEMPEEHEEEHYQYMDTPRNVGLLNVSYRSENPLGDYELLYRIPLSLTTFKNQLDNYQYMDVHPSVPRLNYVIELITPERDLLSGINIVERLKQHRSDREAFKIFAKSREFRKFPLDMKEHILSSMNVGYNPSGQAAPVVAPEAAPVVAPEAAPVVAPEAAPVVAPEAAPVVAPEAAGLKSKKRRSKKRRSKKRRSKKRRS